MKPLPPSTYTPSGRITAPPRETMDDVAGGMYDRSLELFGGPGGPRMPLLHTPRIAEAWGSVNLALHDAPLPARYRELAIIAVAAFWKSEFEWLMHAGEAGEAGIPDAAIEAIRTGAPPRFEEAGDAIAFAYITELQRDRAVTDETYAAARELLGDAGLVALTVAIGHFSNVAMTLNAHRVPLPDGTPPAFIPG